MPSVEQRFWRLGALTLPGVLAALVCGCSSLAGSPTAATPTATPTATAASAPGARAAAQVTADPATQRAFDEARRALAAGQTQQAEQGFVALTRSHPEFGGPHAALGLIYRQAGKLSEASTEFEKAVQASPDQPAYLNELGLNYRMQGRFEQARVTYEGALVVAPDYRDAVLNLGILNDLYLGDGPRALELYERYLVLTPGGDKTVAKWVVELKSRSPQTVAANQKVVR